MVEGRVDHDQQPDERIGILLIHGIGDQRQHEFLQNAAEHFIKTAALAYGPDNIHVEMYPGLGGQSPLSLTLRADGRTTHFELHELWWRDLGERPKFSAIVKFWLWAISLVGTRGFFWDKPTPRQRPPQNLSTRVGFILPHDRLALFFKTTYFFILLLPLALLFELAAQIPGVRRIPLFRSAFTYLSSVQMYQEQRARQGGTLVDFDQSRRISIQRRFVRCVIDMAERQPEYDRWYIAAHSLGSVIAFKGLMLDAHAFAKLVSQNKWEDSDFDRFKTTLTPDSKPYPDQPKRPMWLPVDSAVNIQMVFAKLRGLVTYGSPLETFARTWPAIVHIDKQTLEKGQKLPSDFEWLNLYDPVDVVASRLTSFGDADLGLMGTMKPKNIQCRSSVSILTAHTSYFRPKSTNLRDRILPPLFQWIMEPANCFTVDTGNASYRIGHREAYARKAFALLQWGLVLFAGFFIWPYSLVIVARPLLSVAGVLLFFTDKLDRDVNKYWDIFHRHIVGSLMSGHFLEYLIGALRTTGLVGAALIIAGFIHYVIDVYLDKKEHKTSVTLTARKPTLLAQPPPSQLG